MEKDGEREKWVMKSGIKEGWRERERGVWMEIERSDGEADCLRGFPDLGTPNWC